MAEEAAAEDQETRTKIAFNLGEALDDPSPLFDLARAVEQALFVRKGSDAKDPSYRSAARTLAANIRRNGPLRRRVLDGELSPEALCELSPDELATDEMKRKREKMEERSYKRRTRTTTDTLTDTTKYHCKDCDSNECAYADLKGHRDIRKNETWGSNESADDARVMVVCKQCGACLLYTSPSPRDRG